MEQLSPSKRKRAADEDDVNDRDDGGSAVGLGLGLGLEDDEEVDDDNPNPSGTPHIADYMLAPSMSPPLSVLQTENLTRMPTQMPDSKYDYLLVCVCERACV